MSTRRSAPRRPWATSTRLRATKRAWPKYTYIIDRANDPAAFSHNTIEPAKAQALIDKQSEYIKSRGQLLCVEGYVGLGPMAIPVQWLYTVEAANIAGMQQVMAFPREAVETPEQLAQPFKPALRLVYTPDHAPELPGGQAIIVDLDNYVTHIMGPTTSASPKKVRCACRRRSSTAMAAC